MRFRRTIRQSPGTHTWEHKPEYQAENGGLGMCNTGSGQRMICALGGIGCDVDHITIAKMNLNPSRPIRDGH